MKELNDGGPAFPRPASEYEPNDIRSDGKIAAVPYNGMSLRDWFAGQAMLGLIHQIAAANAIEDCDAITFSDVARDAYFHADAMLKAREVKP
jgi:hypothetical protein